jgi:hypothetical protein
MIREHNKHPVAQYHEVWELVVLKRRQPVGYEYAVGKSAIATLNVTFGYLGDRWVGAALATVADEMCSVIVRPVDASGFRTSLGRSLYIRARRPGAEFQTHRSTAEEGLRSAWALALDGERMDDT